MSNDFTAFNPPLGPQTSNPDLHSPHIETIPLSNNILRSVAHDTVLLGTTNNNHASTLSKGPTPSSGPRVSIGSTCSKEPDFTFLQSKSLTTTYTTDMAMDRGLRLKSRPRVWNPKADPVFCNAAGGVECALEVEGHISR